MRIEQRSASMLLQMTASLRVFRGTSQCLGLSGVSAPSTRLLGQTRSLYPINQVRALLTLMPATSTLRASGSGSRSLAHCNGSNDACSTAGRAPTYRSYSSKDDPNQFTSITQEQYDKSSQRFKSLTYRDIAKVFGPGITAKQGNQLLDTLQKQRVTGTLDLEVTGAGVSKARIARALSWLRSKYPLDEDAAVMARIEREEQIITEWHPQSGRDHVGGLDKVYGESELERRIRQVKEINALREAEEKEAKEKAEAEGRPYTGPTDVAAHRQRGAEVGSRVRRDTSEWVKKYRERAKLSDLEEVPQVNKAAIITSTTIFTAAIIGLCVWFATIYTPPERSQRLLPDIPPAAATVGAIVAINVAVYLLWRFPPLWRFMNKNFLLVAAMPTMTAQVGNIFSHQGFRHLAGNMLGLWFLGTALCDEIGRGRFIALYLASGVFGSWVSLMRFVLTNKLMYTSLGASGAVLGVVAAFCALHPNQHLTIAFIPEDWQQYVSLRAEYVLYTMVLVSFLALFRTKAMSVDHAAHFGGLLGGVTGAELIKRQARLRREQLMVQQRRPFGFGG